MPSRYTKPENALERPQPVLVVKCSNTERQQLPLDQAAIVLGRAPGCDIELCSPEVAAVHCVVTRDGGGFSIRDCRSRAGTRVNGERIDKVPLRDGDLLQVGSFTFEVRLPGEYLLPLRRTAEVGMSAVRLRHVLESRRRLAERALKLRRRLALRSQRQGTGGLSATETSQAADKLISVLRAKIWRYERELTRLQEAERQLAAEREVLAHEAAARPGKQPGAAPSAAHALTPGDFLPHAGFFAESKRLLAQAAADRKAELQLLRQANLVLRELLGLGPPEGSPANPT